MTDTFATVRQRVTDATDRALLDQLKVTTSQLARMVLTTEEAGRADERQRAIAEIEARKDQLEAALSEHSAAFRTELRSVTLEAVQAAMPDDAALVEFAVFRPFDPRSESKDKAYGPPRYAVYVLRAQGAPQGSGSRAGRDDRQGNRAAARVTPRSAARRSRRAGAGGRCAGDPTDPLAPEGRDAPADLA